MRYPKPLIFIVQIGRRTERFIDRHISLLSRDTISKNSKCAVMPRASIRHFDRTPASPLLQMIP